MFTGIRSHSAASQNILASISKILNHRIIESFGLEGTFWGHLVHPCCNEQDHLQLDQVAQRPIQPDLQCFQGRGIYHLSGQHLPVFQLHCKKFLPYVLIYRSNLPFFSLKILSLMLSQPALLKSLSPSFLSPFLRLFLTSEKEERFIFYSLS